MPQLDCIYIVRRLEGIRRMGDPRRGLRGISTVITPPR